MQGFMVLKLTVLNNKEVTQRLYILVWYNLCNTDFLIKNDVITDLIFMPYIVFLAAHIAYTFLCSLLLVLFISSVMGYSIFYSCMLFGWQDWFQCVMLKILMFHKEVFFHYVAFTYYMHFQTYEIITSVGYFMLMNICTRDKQ